MEGVLETKPTREIVEGLRIDTKRLHKTEELLKALEEAQKFTPLKGEVQRKEAAIKGIVEEYFTMRMDENYQPIDADILDLKRMIDVDMSKASVTRKDRYGAVLTAAGSGYQRWEVPVFARAVLDKDAEWREEGRIAADSSNNHTESKATFVSPMPRIPTAIREQGREALAYTHTLYAQALETPVLGEVLLADRYRHADPTQASLLVLWKPRPQDIAVKVEMREKDPILMMQNPLGLYLIDSWEEEDEEPFEQFLRGHMKQKRLDDVTGNVV
ncbi:MAG: hypothetical protein HYS81_05485 [Candidatus Aenigmatarchaeota archaeon]|nr:MAG: hypothetical protein HYS81_05485 [Candidatus Aenigmarchaeota archaeon]